MADVPSAWPVDNDPESPSKSTSRLSTAGSPLQKGIASPRSGTKSRKGSRLSALDAENHSRRSVHSAGRRSNASALSARQGAEAAEAEEAEVQGELRASNWTAARASWTNRARRKAGKAEDPQLAELAEKAEQRRKREEDEYAAAVRQQISDDQAAQTPETPSSPTAAEMEKWLDQATRRPIKRSISVEPTRAGATVSAMEMRRLKDEMDVVRALYAKRCDEVIALKKAIATPFGLPVDLPQVGDERTMLVEEQQMLLKARDVRIDKLEAEKHAMGESLKAIKPKVKEVKTARLDLHQEAQELRNFKLAAMQIILQIKNQIPSIDEEFKQVGAKVLLLTAERDNLQEEVNQQKTKISRLEKESQEQQAKIAKLKKDFEEFEARMLELSKQIAEKDAEINELQRTISRMEIEHKAKLVALREENEQRLKTQEAEFKMRTKQLETLVAVTKGQLVAAERRLEEADRRHQKQVAQLEKQKEQLGNKVQEKEDELLAVKEKAQDDIAKLRAQLKKKEEEVGQISPQQLELLLMKMGGVPGDIGGSVDLQKMMKKLLQGDKASEKSRGDPKAKKDTKRISTTSISRIHNVVDRLYAREERRLAAWEKKKDEFMAAKEEHSLSLAELVYHHQEQDDALPDTEAKKGNTSGGADLVADASFGYRDIVKRKDVRTPDRLPLRSMRPATGMLARRTAPTAAGFTAAPTQLPFATPPLPLTGGDGVRLPVVSALASPTPPSICDSGPSPIPMAGAVDV